jgi:hypothetical protein
MTTVTTAGATRELTTALDDLGHDCPGSCAEAAHELGARLWFVRRGPDPSGRGSATLVVLDASDYEGTRDRSRQLIRTLNDCLRPDGIRVSERRIDDSGLALAACRRQPHRTSGRPTTTRSLHLVGDPS